MLRTAILASLIVAGTAAAQQPPVRPQTATPSAPASAPPKPAYSYNPEGRRDPFVSLLGRGSEPRSNSKRADGLGGLLAGEIALKGIFQSKGTFVAIVQGPDSRSYLVHPNDRLFDGRIKAVTSDSLIILQEVNDPLSLTKQREITKSLHGPEGK